MLVVNESIVLSFVVVNCGDPGTPANGVRYGDVFTYKSTILLECDPQYKLVGDLTRTCQADGSWTGSQPTCHGKQKDQLLLKGAMLRNCSGIQPLTTCHKVRRNIKQPQRKLSTAEHTQNKARMGTIEGETDCNWRSIVLNYKYNARKTYFFVKRPRWCQLKVFFLLFGSISNESKWGKQVQTKLTRRYILHRPFSLQFFNSRGADYCVTFWR